MGMTVLVTGAGGPAGVSVIGALDRAGMTVVATDCDPHAVGLALVERSGVIPRADDPSFIDAVGDLALQTGANALVCTVAEELEVFATHADELTGFGLAHWLPEKAAVRACVDKWEFAQVCARGGVAVPATALGTVDGVPGPWIVKPRFGRGSRDVFAVDDPAEIPWIVRRVEDALVQTRLPGREFTSDALVDRDGRLAGAAHRWRLETRGGISTRGRTFDDASLTHAVAGLLAVVGLTGPACVQGFIDDDGTLAFTEVNPRFSGGLPLSLAAGADLVGEYVRGMTGEAIRPERLVPRAGVEMARYFTDVFSG